MLSTIKKVFLWTYARNTWQWDILCVLILAFIFLTPKGWFEGSERRPNLMHQRGTSATLVVGPEVIENQRDSVRLVEHVRLISGRPDAEVVQVRKVAGQDGKTVAYQVDIR